MVPLSEEGVESLPVFAVKHHLQLLPSGLSVISFFCINVEGFQVIYGSGIEDFSVTLTAGGGIEVEFWVFPSGRLPL